METDHGSLFYITTIVRNHRHLLVHEGCARTALGALDFPRRRGEMELFGFVILPSRLHFHCRPRGEGMTRILARFETYTSSRMMNQLRRGHRTLLMQSFYSGTQEESILGALHSEEVAKTDKEWMLLEAMHALPVSREWRLVESPESYPFSSACFYADGTTPAIPVNDFRSTVMRGEPAGAPFFR